MSFIQKVRYEVRPQVRSRGQAYFANGRVRNVRGDRYNLTAQVEGSQLYHINAFRDRNYLVVHCDCPYFQDNEEACKHVWAALLAAESRGFLEGDGKGRRLRLELELDNDQDDEAERWEESRQHLERERGAPESNRETRGGTSPAQRQQPRQQPRQPQQRQPASGRAEPVQPGEGKGRRRRRRKKKQGTTREEWQKQLTNLKKGTKERPREQGQHDRQGQHGRSHWGSHRQLLYVVEATESMQAKKLHISLLHRDRKRNGEWTKPKIGSIFSDAIGELSNPEDRKILSLLKGADTKSSGYSYHEALSRLYLDENTAETFLPLMCRTNRCYLRTGPDGEWIPLNWDEGGPWSFALHLAPVDGGKSYEVVSTFRRGHQAADLSAARLILPGLVFWRDRVGSLARSTSQGWIEYFQREPGLNFPAAKKTEWLQQFFRLPNLPPVGLPRELEIQEVDETPLPRLRLQPFKDVAVSRERVEGLLMFDYGGQIADAGETSPVFDARNNLLMHRDFQAEADAQARLLAVGFTNLPEDLKGAHFEIFTRHVPRVVAQLVADGWFVEADGKMYRSPGKFDIEVTTGIDWFELHGKVLFGDTEVALPDLLQAVRRGEDSIVLGDGSVGMLPDDWLKKYGLLAGLGRSENGHLRFQKNQAGLLDALVTAQPEARYDAGFRKSRDELRNFEGIQPAEPPADFQGELRSYQKEGLGWLHFLDRFGFGGCLADDMGLGKTIQVLALLDERRQLDPPPGPSLVVVPRSLVFNWKNEAAKFTPNLRVLDHTGMNRRKAGEHFTEHDLILTTYGTLRRDAINFKDHRFDYCILDEAQAIKNAKSESARAARLIQANHRLAVTGTPVENHLGELWSLFEFLNPGMLGQASVFQTVGVTRNPEPETREMLAKAIRPFLLRRTKEQVARDLPQKTEQTIYAEMEPEQRKLYEDLREHYRASLLAKVAKEGVGRSKIQILEALLRLRQAACHPGLIDKERVGESSAKLDVLMPQLLELLDEGHKALVFSQFTSMLAIVRERLDAEKITYEYLDGRTQKRNLKVERFQNDPECKLFLISLKAGGVGLNLTGAEYVFLLDPWWNPAVEAQAIDRTHRIGQEKPVFAYRLIVKDTVEEKVLELQNKKKELADAILNADGGLMKQLGAEDLEMLLS